MNINVAVRVRPFIRFELQSADNQCCIDIEGNSTIITDPKSLESEQFLFNNSFWSHDGFVEREDGLCLRTSSKFAGSEDINEEYSTKLLNNLLEGYNSCIFSYGQTASGKTFSMYGIGNTQGIIPYTCEKLLSRLNNLSENEILISMYEIYTEEIYDLLVPKTSWPKHGLKIRTNSDHEFFVENLSKHPVRSPEDFQELIRRGSTNKRSFQALMNQIAGYSHVFLILELKQRVNQEDKVLEMSSFITFADLAAKQRVFACATLEKYVISLNSSIAALQTVVKNLANPASRGGVIRYRESALTRILANALGGNCKTYMICTLSPSSKYYEDTKKDLKFASVVKKIRNQPVPNQYKEI
ncbi:unnamed protein product [Blepharisma stoltei]|uniref:Kinesin motor domain-containing protein n=1 Tax=Blepharisma stoltei TaxID=1481888 RepID=A0AAU9JF31_9CILI|nr:unnamed protein product [Blepharisma stoltei]